MSHLSYLESLYESGNKDKQTVGQTNRQTNTFDLPETGWEVVMKKKVAQVLARNLISSGLLPDEPFHNFEASKLVVRRL